MMLDTNVMSKDELDWYRLMLDTNDDVRFGDTNLAHVITQVMGSEYANEMTDTLVIRQWGTQVPIHVRRDQVTPIFKSCECGAVLLSGWKLCHPEA